MSYIALYHTLLHTLYCIAVEYIVACKNTFIPTVTSQIRGKFLETILKRSFLFQYSFIVLYCIVLYCISLIVLYCSVLYYSVACKNTYIPILKPQIREIFLNHFETFISVSCLIYVLCYFVLYDTALHSLYCIAWHCIALYCIVLDYISLIQSAIPQIQMVFPNHFGTFMWYSCEIEWNCNTDNAHFFCHIWAK